MLVPLPGAPDYPNHQIIRVVAGNLRCTPLWDLALGRDAFDAARLSLSIDLDRHA
jgi:hypothetical protein